MIPPRFLLILSAQSNLLRASLVTRELQIVAFARQTFQVTILQNGMQEFDPAQVWYSTKKVIAACFDIGRTLSREIAGVVIVGESNTRVVWSQQADEVVASGRIEPVENNTSHTTSEVISEVNPSSSGTMAAWLLWNLTGADQSEENSDYGKTCERAPFDAELPIVAVVNAEAGDLSPEMGQGAADQDRILHAAEAAWRQVDRRT